MELIRQSSDKGVCLLIISVSSPRSIHPSLSSIISSSWINFLSSLSVLCVMEDISSSSSFSVLLVCSLSESQKLEKKYKSTVLSSLSFVLCSINLKREQKKEWAEGEKFGSEESKYEVEETTREAVALFGGVEERNWRLRQKTRKRIRRNWKVRWFVYTIQPDCRRGFGAEETLNWSAYFHQYLWTEISRKNRHNTLTEAFKKNH